MLSGILQTNSFFFLFFAFQGTAVSFCFGFWRTVVTKGLTGVAFIVCRNLGLEIPYLVDFCWIIHALAFPQEKRTKVSSRRFVPQGRVFQMRSVRSFFAGLTGVTTCRTTTPCSQHKQPIATKQNHNVNPVQARRNGM